MLNEILGAAARYEQLLARKFGVQGGAPSPQLTPEITPSYNIPAGAEDLLPCGMRLCSGYISIGAVAAKRPVTQLRNPVGTNILGVVSYIGMMSSTAGVGQHCMGFGKLNNNLPNLPAAGGYTMLDGRAGLNAAGGFATRAPTCTLTADNEPPEILPPNILYRVQAQYAWTEQFPAVILSPGWGVQAFLSDNVYGVAAVFRWYEVVMAEGEVGPF